MPTSLKHEELTKKVIGVFYDVYNELGHGFIESVYQNAMVIAMVSLGLIAESKIKIPVSFRNRIVGNFEADIIVDKQLILELKSASTLVAANEAQLLNYLRATDIEVGLLFNFGEKPAFKRLVYENNRKGISRRKSLIDHILKE